jgi:hypothetical protein
MSHDARAVPRVETVQVDLSEKGLTDLSAMLIKSGLFSAASFREWSHRTQQLARRWVHKTKPLGGEKKANKRGSNTALSGQKPPSKGGKSNKKSKEKFLVLKKLIPSCTLGNWDEVNNQSHAKMVALQTKITKKRQEILAVSSDIKSGLADLGLTEEEIKLSRAFFPYLPKFQDLSNRKSLGECVVSSPPVSNPDGSDEIVSVGNTDGDVKIASDLGSNKIASDHVSSGQTAATTVEAGALRSTEFLPADSKPDSEGAAKPTVDYGRYNWSSVPQPIPKGLNKALQGAAHLVGDSNKSWSRRSLAEKFRLLDTHFQPRTVSPSN